MTYPLYKVVGVTYPLYKVVGVTYPLYKVVGVTYPFYMFKVVSLGHTLYIRWCDIPFIYRWSLWDMLHCTG